MRTLTAEELEDFAEEYEVPPGGHAQVPAILEWGGLTRSTHHYGSDEPAVGRDDVEVR